MAQLNSQFFPVILDTSTHRVIKLGVSLSAEPGFDLVLNTKRDPATGQPVDTFVFHNGGGALAIRSARSFIPPNTGDIIEGPPSISRPECTLFPNVDRVVMLGQNLSADPAHELTLVDNTPAGQVERSHVFIINSGGNTIRMDGGGQGLKIPPNTD
jgi:hypothetical protein